MIMPDDRAAKEAQEIVSEWRNRGTWIDDRLVWIIADKSRETYAEIERLKRDCIYWEDLMQAWCKRSADLVEDYRALDDKLRKAYAEMTCLRAELNKKKE